MAESSLAPGRRVAFGDCQLDVASHRLWKGGREVPLRPKSWDVLRFLVEHPGRLVTKEALHREVWPDTVVSDDTLTKSISELRQALGDDPRAPRFIETVHGLGFRFVADVHGPASKVAQTIEPSRAPVPGRTQEPTFVGRQRELDLLHECFRQAAQGTRQIVFVTGEAGIGKTALTQEFLRSPALAAGDGLVLHGQCIQQHGQREAYMPVLEALERVLASPAGAWLVPLFRRIAPCWHVQIPWLLSEAEPQGFQGSMLSAPPQRMLREISAFLETVAARSTVVLVLEDLHWSDHATTDLVSFLAERPDRARLLIIGTYRPAEASTQDHPIRQVKQTLRAHRRCVELSLDYLSLASVREYLGRRFGEPAPDLAPLVHRRTDGNPLFVVAIVEELIRSGRLVQTDGIWAVDATAGTVDLAVPDDLVEMFTAQFQRLAAEEREILEAGSVVGMGFAARAVARALGRDVDGVEAVTERLVRSRLFLNAASLPDAAAHYEFSHALHHQVIYEQIPGGRCRRLHQRVGEAVESASGDGLGEVAPELSVHFERSGDHARAIKYLGLCVVRAQQRFAYREAVAYGTNALALLDSLPASVERDQRELELRLLLGGALNLTRGYVSPEVKENYDRARALCEKVGAARQLFEIVHAAWYRHLAGADQGETRRVVEELAGIAERLGAGFHWRAALARGRTDLWSGRFGTAVPVLLGCVDEVERLPAEARVDAYGVDPALAAFAQCGFGLWFIGQPDRARAFEGRGMDIAEQLGRPFELASALCHAAFVELVCGGLETAASLAARAHTLSAENDLAYFLAISRAILGAVAAERGDVVGGLDQILAGLAGLREAGGTLLADIQLAWAAAAYGRAGRWGEGIRAADEGIALPEGALGRLFAAELWRVKGELILGKARAGTRAGRALDPRTVTATRRCYEHALGIARAQEARSLELRAAMSLARLPGPPDETRTARGLLRALYASFTEGFDTRDLVDAKTLLDDPARAPRK